MPVRSPSAQADHRGDQPGGEAKARDGYFT
jgi:hypothetical protein